MKTAKLTLVLIAIAGFMTGFTPDARGSTSSPAGEPKCVVVNPGSGAQSIKTQMSLVYNALTQDIYLTLRMERNGKTHWFRLYINESLEGKLDEEIACILLDPGFHDPGSTNEAAVQDFVEAILSEPDFNFSPGNTVLALTYTSLENNMGVFDCIEGNQNEDPVNCIIPGTEVFMPGDPPVVTGIVSTLGDVTIYAVDPLKASFVNF